MLMKTAELTGAALDWAVAKCDGKKPHVSENEIWVPTQYHNYVLFNPSTNWAQGGPIIERGEVVLMPDASSGWIAKVRAHAGKFIYGQTPLIAAMRYYVASKLGDYVDVPEELAC